MKPLLVSAVASSFLVSSSLFSASSCSDFADFNLSLSDLISAFRIAQELAMAMESRCYRGGTGRTKFHVMKIKGSDIAAMLIAIGILAEMIIQRIMLPVIF